MEYFENGGRIPFCPNNTCYPIFLLDSRLINPVLKNGTGESPGILYHIILPTFLSLAITYSILKTNFLKLGLVLDKIRILLEDLALILLTVAWMTVLALPFGILLTWRLIVTLALRFKYGRHSCLVDAMDAIGTVDSINSRQIITSLKVLQGNESLSLEYLRSSCQKTIERRDSRNELVYPKFFQVLDKIGGFFCWRPAEFDIRHHVRLLSPDLMRESEVLEKLSSISNQAFQPGRANWEILFVPKFQYDDDEGIYENVGQRERDKDEHSEKGTSKQALIIRINHAIGDGFSLMKLIMRDVAGERGEIIPEKFQKKKYTSFFSGLGIFLYLTLKSGRALYREILRKDVNPLHHGVLTGEKHVVWSRRIDLEVLKATKNRMETGMSTLLLAAATGSLHRYINQKYNSGESGLLQSLSAVIPVPAPNHPDNRMCNKFSVVMMTLPTVSSSASTNCQLIDKEARALAQSPDAPLNIFLMSLAGLMPAWFYGFFLTNTQSTVLISNIPGPNRGIKLWGHTLVDTMFWLPSLGVSGISISFLSYKSHLRIGITVDTGVITSGQVGANEILQGILKDLSAMAILTNEMNSSILQKDYNNNNNDDTMNDERKPSNPIAKSILIQRTSINCQHSIN